MMHRNPKKAQSLLKASEGATHASVVTANAAEALKSGTLSKRDLIKLSSHLEKAAKAMEIVKENTDAGAGQLGGAGTKYAHQRFKVYDESAKKEQTPGGAPKATPLSDLTDFVNTATDTQKAREKRKNRENISRKAKKKPEVVLPVPANMVKYTQSEAGGILAAVSNCGDAIKEMHRLGYTDLSITRLYELSKLVKNGTPILNRNTGRPALATVPQIKEFVSTVTEGGNTVGSREMRLALMGFEEERRRSSGISAIGLKIHPKVVQLYVGAAASLAEGRATSSAMEKSENRYVAECSLISTMTQVLAMGVTSFIPVEGKGSNSKFALMVSEASGGIPVQAASPLNTWSTDDTTLFVTTNVAGEQEMRVASASVKGKTAGVFKLDSPDYLSGCRVRLTTSLSGGGMSAPFYATITGLSERELSHPSGMLVVKVPGLCHGGASDYRANEVGYLVFLRRENENGDKMEQLNFSYYRNHVLLPTIEGTREKFFGYRKGEPVTPDLTAISWNDGGGPQLKSITEEQQQAKEAGLRILSAKHPAAMTGVAQPCDVGPQFRVLKQLEKMMERGSSAPSLAINALVDTALKKNSDILTLKPHTRAAVISFASRVPQMMSAAFKQEHAVASFVETGFLDRETKSGPCFDGALANCRRALSQQEEELCVRTFPVLFEAMEKNGHVPDDVFVALGYPRDLNSKGEEIDRPATISGENRQRAKVLSHAEQRALRQAVKDDAADKEAAHVASENAKKSVVLSLNRTAETAIFLHLGKPATSSRNQLSLATPEMVAKLSKGELQAFCHCRKFDTTKAKGTWPKKGKVGEAAENLISWAHGLLGADLLLKASAPVPARLAVPAALHGVAPLVVTAATGLAAVSGELPSVMLRNGAWLASVYLNVLGCPDAFLGGSPTTADCERADLLRELLYARLQTHKDARVEVASKRASWVFEWTEENLAPVAAISVAFGHVHNDLGAATGQTTLLSARDERFVLACNAMALGEGCYTHRNQDTGCWVRSGKVVGKERSFGVRNAEHARCSQLLTSQDLASRFYCSYPAQSSEVQTGAARRGYFGSLEQYVGLGFMRTNQEAVNALCSSTSEDRLLSWSASHLERTAAVNFPGSPSMVEKQLHMVGYLFELAYDLMISPRDNVSRSPGFETPLGIFGGS